MRPPPERPSTPKRTNLSIYSTLAKYGIATNTKSIRRRKTQKLKAPQVSSAPQSALYRPSSLDALLARLETFRLTTYSTKPPELEAVQAALAGWTNDGKERLVCNLCHGSWVVAGTGGMTIEAAKVLTERQLASLITEHKEGCPWRTRRCDRMLLLRLKNAC